MRNLALVAMITLLAVPAGAKNYSSPEALVQAVETAERAGDVRTLRELVGADFVQHHASGVIEPRAAYLADRARPAMNPSTGRDYLERDVEWRIVERTAVRTSLTRIRGAKPGQDLWVRSTVVAIKAPTGWRLVNLDSALLYEGPSYDAPASLVLPTSEFESAESGKFRFLLRGGQAYAVFASGRMNPLIPIGKDIYWCGNGSTLTLERGADASIVAATRRYGDRIAWRALAHP